MNSKPVELTPEVREAAANTGGTSSGREAQLAKLAFDSQVRVVEAKDSSFRN